MIEKVLGPRNTGSVQIGANACMPRPTSSPGETSLRDADDLETRWRAERDCLSKYARFCAVRRSPIGLAQHSDRRAAALIVGDGEESSERRLHSKRAKVIAAHEVAGRVPNLATVVTEIEPHRRVGERAVEDFLIVANLLPDRIRERPTSRPAS